MPAARALLRVPIVLVRHAPALLAWYLAGETVRAAVLAIAAPIGPEQSPLLGLLLVPLAVLARLVAYIGMFLTVRPSLPALVRLGGYRDRPGFRAVVAEFTGILLAGIVPFFALYGLIGGVDADLVAYQRAAFSYSFAQAHASLDLGDQPLFVVLVVVIAFIARQVLRRLGDRIPRGFAIVAIYLEATWVFVAFSGISAVFGSAVQWVQDRQIVSWITHARASLIDLWDGFRVALDGLGWATPLAVQLILLPLAWLLIAGVIYTRALDAAAEARVVPARVEARLRASLVRVPRPVRHQLGLLRDDWDETYKPLVVTGRLIARAGIRNLAAFVAAYAVLYAAGQWLARGVVLAVGAHDERFWNDWLPLISLCVALVIEPIRIALLGSAFDGALARWEARAATASASSAPAAAPAAASRP